MRRYINFKGYKIIPGIHHGYTINIHGELACKTGHLKEPIKVDEFGKWYKLLDVEGQVVTVNLAVLVSMVARNVSWPITVCSKLTMYFLDGDNANVHPSNTVWRPFPKNVEWKPGIRYIPDYSNYAISRDGNLFNTVSETQLKWDRNEKNPVAKIVLDIVRNPRNKTTVNLSKYRALMLAWSEYSMYVHELKVNYCSNINSECILDNLEWVVVNVKNKKTSKTPIAVIIRNIYTKKETLFSNLELIANLFSIDNNQVLHRCNSDGQLIYDEHQWRLLKSKTEWKTIIDINDVVGRSVRIKNIITGDELMFNSLDAAAIHFKVPLLTIVRWCGTDGLVNYCDHLWKYNDSTTQWPASPEKAYYVQFGTLNAKLYNNLSYIEKLLSIKKYTLSKHFKKNNIYLHNNIKISKVMEYPLIDKNVG